MSTEQKASLLDILHLTSQAWDAYYQKRTRECLALAKALVQSDPENSEAHAIQAAVRADLQKDVNDARILLEASGDGEDAKKHRKTAEVMLLKVIYLDPENREAKVLLSAAKALQGGAPASSISSIAVTASERNFEPEPEPIAISQRIAVPEPLVNPEPVAVRERVAISEPAAIEAPVAAQIPLAFQSPAVVSKAPEPAPAPARVFTPPLQMATPAPTPMHVPVPKSTERADSFVVGPKRTKAPSESKLNSRIPFILGTIAFIIAALILLRHNQTTSQNTASASVLPAAAAPPPVAFTPSEPVWSPPVAAPAPTPEKAPAPPPSATVSVHAPPPVAYAPANLVPVETGSLAVSSPTAAEIYKDDKYLGSTPTTLELPAGSHTLEYRHQNLRTVVTHVVKAHETTTALVTFDIVVQLNARPWAQVYIDGAQRQALGQTPLSNMRVPIGRVLVFENPNFPAKTYRVTGNEKTIQMIFP